jgi:hypothetical protein
MIQIVPHLNDPVPAIPELAPEDCNCGCADEIEVSNPDSDPENPVDDSCCVEIRKFETRWVSCGATTVTEASGALSATVKPAKWLVSSVPYQTLTDQVLAISDVAAGLERIDFIAGNNAGLLVYVPGTAAPIGTALRPVLTQYQAEIRFLYVTQHAAIVGQSPVGHVQNTDTAGLLADGTVVTFQQLWDRKPTLDLINGGGTSDANFNANPIF